MLPRARWARGGETASDSGNLRGKELHRTLGFFEGGLGFVPRLVVGGVVDAVVGAGEIFGLAVDARAGGFLERGGFRGNGFQESLEVLLGIVGDGDVLFLDRRREIGVFGLDGFPEVGEFFGDGDFEFRSVAVAVIVIVRVVFPGEGEGREGEGGDGCEQGWCFHRLALGSL